MGASSITRVRNGETVSVRTGVLRGAGPQGPMGVQGPIGPAGPTGPAGPSGSISDVYSRLTSSASVALSSAGFVDMALDTVGATDLINVVDNYNFQVKATGLYALAINATYAWVSGSKTGLRAWQLVDAAGTVVMARSSEAVGNADTVVGGVDILNLDASKTYKLQGKTNDPGGGINCTARSLNVARFGSGPQGPTGAQGPVGSTGPQGPQGVAGSAASGFVSYNLVNSATSDTTLDPATDAAVVAPNKAYSATADQIIPIPLGTTAPHTPFFLSAMATYLEKRINSRFASTTDRNTRRATRVQGEIYTLLDTGTWFVKEKNGNEEYLARVKYSTSAAPAGTGQAAPGVIWIQT